jgi:Flp pilus assembly protein CpaB
LRTVADGTVIAESVLGGEPLVRARVGRAGAGPVAAVLAPGRRAVAIPVGDAPPPVAVGDQVDLVAAGSALEARVVAVGASVVAVHERSVVVSVAADELPGVAAGMVDGTVVVAVSG